jgi:hypothetical protein
VAADSRGWAIKHGDGFLGWTENLADALKIMQALAVDTANEGAPDERRERSERA